MATLADLFLWQKSENKIFNLTKRLIVTPFCICKRNLFCYSDLFKFCIHIPAVIQLFCFVHCKSFQIYWNCIKYIKIQMRHLIQIREGQAYRQTYRQTYRHTDRHTDPPTKRVLGEHSLLKKHLWALPWRHTFWILYT